MDSSGEVVTDIIKNIGTITFSHPKGNSLPKHLLNALADSFEQMALNTDVRVVILRSSGEGAFCGGASFNELLEINSMENGKEFFMGFARVILAMKNCPKFIITRVQGKAVGGGVGLIAASDYVLALDSASIKLSELEIGLGPFVVGPAIVKKVGSGAFNILSIDCNWHHADWCKTHSLYSEVFPEHNQLDKAVTELVVKLSKYNPEAMRKLKSALWQDTDDWEKLLEKRAEISGKLVLSEFTSSFISEFRRKD